MKVSTTCSCGRVLKVNSELAGRKVRCPNCQSVVRVPVPPQASQPAAPAEPHFESSSDYQFSELQSENTPDLGGVKESPVAIPEMQASPVANPQPRRGIVVPRSAIWTASVIAALVLGYFIGREHFKSQMRSALAEAFSVAKDELTTPVDRNEKTNPLPEPSEPPPGPSKPLGLGETHSTERFSITLTSARIDRPKIEELGGETSRAESPALLLSFTFANKDERKLLRYWEGNSFGPGYFRLRDDVDNDVRGVTYGYSSKPAGSLGSIKDIDPVTTVTHVEVFSVPLPKTQYVVLSVNLKCLDGDGEIEYMIPVTSIEGFAAENK